MPNRDRSAASRRARPREVPHLPEKRVELSTVSTDTCINSPTSVFSCSVSSIKTPLCRGYKDVLGEPRSAPCRILHLEVHRLRDRSAHKRWARQPALRPPSLFHSAASG